MTFRWPEQLRPPNLTPLREWPGTIAERAQAGRASGAQVGERIAGDTGQRLGAGLGMAVGGALGGLELVSRPLNYLAEETERILGAFSLVASKPEARREIARVNTELAEAQRSGNPARIAQARQREIAVSRQYPRNPIDVYYLVTAPDPEVRKQAFELPARLIEGVTRAAAARPEEWQRALQSADVGAYTPGLIERAYTRIAVNGEDPEEVAADLIPEQNIWAELIGQTALDPLNVVQAAGVGKWLRQSARTSSAKRWFLKPDPRNVDEVMQSLGRNLSPTGTAGFVRRVNPFALTTESRKMGVLDDAAYVMQGVMWNGQTTDEKLRLLARWANDLSEEGLRRFARETGVSAVVSTPGKRAAGIFQAMGGGEGMTKALKRAVTAAKREGLESPVLEQRAMERFLYAMSGALDTAFPSTASIYEVVTKPILKARRPLDNALATLYMGINPAFTVRNASNNLVTTLVDGVHPFTNQAKINRWWDDFGGAPLSAGRGIGGTGVRADTKPWNFSLRAGQSVEQQFANTTVYAGASDVMRKLWPKRVRDLVDDIPNLSPDQRRYLISRLSTALNGQQVDDIIRGLAGGAGPHFDVDAMNDALRFPGVADEVARLAADTPNPTAFRANAAAQLRKEIQRLTKQAGEAPLVRGEPAAEALQRLMAQYPRAARDPQWFGQISAKGFEKANEARGLMWRAADSPEKVRLAQLYQEWFQKAGDRAFRSGFTGDRASIEAAMYNQRAIDWARDLYRQFTGADMPVERFQVILGPIARPIDDLAGNILNKLGSLNPRYDAIDEAATAGQKLIDSVQYRVTPLTGLEEWARRVKGDLNDIKLVAARVGTAARDFSLLDYRKRRGIDTVLSTFLLYPYWGSRTYPNWASRFVTNPGVFASYLRFKDALRKVNADAAPWLQSYLNLETVGLPTPLYVSLESLLNPMQSIVSDFDDEERRKTALGELVSLIDKAGFSAHSILPWAYAVERWLSEDPEAAIAMLGHVSGATRALKYATGLTGIGPEGGLTLEPWLWRGQPFLGGDKWAYRRATRQLAAMEQRGEITPTEARAAARAMSVQDASNPHLKEALKREAKERGWPTLVAYVLGPGVRYVTEEERLIDDAYAAQAEMYAQREGMSDAEWSAAWDSFYQQYPFMRTLSLARKDREKADDAWAYDVLARLAPGTKMKTAAEFGIPNDLLSKFYDDKGTANFTPPERMRLMAGILEMAQKYDVPTPALSAEWAEVSKRQNEMYAQARQRWPNIDAISDGYYAAKERNAHKDYLAQHPELIAYWEWLDAYRANDPVLRFHTGKDPRQQAIDTIWDAYHAASPSQKRAWRDALGRSWGAFLGKNYDAVRDEELFTWVTMLTGREMP